jgi:sugar lactone lactonase YvrE
VAVVDVVHGRTVECGSDLRNEHFAVTSYDTTTFDRDRPLALPSDDVALPNGFGFTPGRESLYFAETAGETITRYVHDEESGAISDPETFADSSSEEGSLDGTTVDATGSVRVAL